MKKSFLIFFLFFVSISIDAQTNTYDLTVKVSGIEKKKGMLQFGLYRGPDYFAQVGKTYRMMRVKVEASEESVTFHNLPKGKYAVCIYLDENNNDHCDMNFFGIPTEKYAFSNDDRPILSIPSFESCSIYLNEHKSIVIRVDY